MNGNYGYGHAPKHKERNHLQLSKAPLFSKQEYTDANVKNFILQMNWELNYITQAFLREGLSVFFPKILPFFSFLREIKIKLFTSWHPKKDSSHLPVTYNHLQHYSQSQGIFCHTAYGVFTFHRNCSSQNVCNSSAVGFVNSTVRSISYMICFFVNDI